MIENELVHVFVGVVDGEPNLNPEEASAVQLIDLDSLKAGTDLVISDQTAWLRHYLDHHLDELHALKRALPDSL